MARPADWSPLADSDPVPGDPLEVAALGRRFAATAAEIASAAKRLRTMCTDEFWGSAAGPSFQQRGVETAAKLDAAHARYATAAIALGTDPADPSPSTAARPNYAAALAQAQGLAERTLPVAQAAARSQRVAMARLEAFSATLPPSALVPDASGHLPYPLPLGLLPAAEAEVVGEWARQYNAAAAAIAASRAAIASAERIRDVAAANASHLISGVINSDGLADSWRDYVATFIDEHAEVLAVTSALAGQVAAVCVPLALKMGGDGPAGQAPEVIEAAGCRLTVPEGWLRIGLLPEGREPALARLVAQQEIRQELLRVARHAYDNGGVELYISPQAAAGFPLPASLVVTRTPPHDEPRVVVSPKRLSGALARDGSEVTVAEFPAGLAVRVLRRAGMTSLDIHFPVPDSGAYLMLSFSTPLDELSDAMVGLFDSIAGTLRWI